MEKTVGAILGILGAGITSIFGGWDKSVTTLLLFMLLDYITGLICAGIFKSSPKTKNGGLASDYCWKGLAKKIVTLIFVIIGCQLDLLLGSNYIRDAVCICFIVTELISITENAGLMGVPIPRVLTNAIEVLKDREDLNNEN